MGAATVARDDSKNIKEKEEEREKKKPNVKKKENLMISALPLYPHQVDNKVG
jgi:hypothetical protein